MMGVLGGEWICEFAVTLADQVHDDEDGHRAQAGQANQADHRGLERLGVRLGENVGGGDIEQEAGEESQEQHQD